MMCILMTILSYNYFCHIPLFPKRNVENNIKYTFKLIMIIRRWRNLWKNLLSSMNFSILLDFCVMYHICKCNKEIIL